jgi:2'-5' RNA ligase
MEEKSRTFIAVEIGEEILRSINDYSVDLQRKNPSGFRWVKADNLHLTLKFIGDTRSDQIVAVKQILNNLCNTREPFQLEINGTGAFPSWSHPRTIWIGLKLSDELKSFYRNLDSALAAIGIPTEGERFSPHLTLCRVTDHAAPQVVQNLCKDIQETPLTFLYSWQVERVVYLKSKLQPGGPIYSLISEHLFKKSEKVC